MHGAAKLVKPDDRGIDVVDGDIAEPARLRAGSPRLRRQRHQSANAVSPRLNSV